MPLTLKIHGCGNIVSFKNSKMICAPKGRRPMLITDPKKQKAMESYIRAIASQLNSLFQTDATGMSMGCSLPSWIASSVPLDDSWHWIPKQGENDCELCEPGQEGAIITIEKLTS